MTDPGAREAFNRETLDREAFDRVVAAEAMLLDPPVRRDPERLARLLAPNFREIGQSGRLWDREGIIAALCSDPGPPGTPWRMSDRHLEPLAEGLYLLTYALESAGRRSLRSSIWRLDADGEQLVFHQGTAVPG